MNQPSSVGDGRFELRGPPIVGGMGRVYQGVDRETGAKVAIKIVPAQAGDEAARFAREAAILSRLDDPSLVRYVAHGEVEGGGRYVAMEWAEGETLAQRIATKGLRRVEAVEVIAKVARAVAKVHAIGFVHRDLKPENVMIGEGLSVKIIDFGISREAGDAGLTRTGYAVGTLGYMAPEQARGQRDLDARADVFALGCALFECLAGSPLFSGPNVLIVRARVLFETPVQLGLLLNEIPADLGRLLVRMLAKNRDERPRDASEVAAAIDALEPMSDAPEPPYVPIAQRPTLQPNAPTVRDRVATSKSGLLSVVLAAVVDVGSLSSAKTMSLPELEKLGKDLTAITAIGEPRIELLADGSVVAVLTSSDDPAEHVARAARCALALRAIFRSSPVVLMTGRDAKDGEPLESILGRGARAAAVAAVVGRKKAQPHASSAGIVLDELTAELLDSKRFRVEAGSKGPRLMGQIAD